MSFQQYPTTQSRRSRQRRSYTKFVFMPEVNYPLIEDSIAIQAIFESDQPEQWELGKRKLFEHPTMGFRFCNRIALSILRQLDHMQLLSTKMPRKFDLAATEKLYLLFGQEMDSEAFVEASDLIQNQVLRCTYQEKSNRGKSKPKIPPLVSAMRKYDATKKLNCWEFLDLLRIRKALMKWASRRETNPSVQTFSSMSGSRTDEEGSDYEPVAEKSNLNDQLVGEETEKKLLDKLMALAELNAEQAAVYLLRHWNNAGFPPAWREHFRDMIYGVANNNGRTEIEFDQGLEELESHQAGSANQSKWQKLDIRITVHHHKYVENDRNRKRVGQRIIKELGGTSHELCTNCNDSVGHTIDEVEAKFEGGPKLLSANQYTHQQQRQRLNKKFCLSCRHCGYHLEVRNRGIVEMEKKPVEKLVSPQVVGEVLNIKKNTVSQYYLRARLKLAEPEAEVMVPNVEQDNVRDEDLIPFRLNEDIDSFLRQKVCSEYDVDANENS